MVERLDSDAVVLTEPGPFAEHGEMLRAPVRSLHQRVEDLIGLPSVQPETLRVVLSGIVRDVTELQAAITLVLSGVTGT